MKRGLKLSCFIVIGFPDDTPATLRQHAGAHPPHGRARACRTWRSPSSCRIPGSALFRRLQQEGKLELDDQFFVSPMDFYTAKAPSYADAVSTRRLYWTMLWMFVNFYVISFALRPWRMIRTLLRAVFTGTEESRYAKWFVDIFYTRRRWRKIAGRGRAVARPGVNAR